MIPPQAKLPPSIGESYPIAVVADRTGLSPDVLRAWERRYQVVKPTRGQSGQRRYSSEDIERLTLLHAVTRAGRSIGEVANLPRDELQRMADEDVAVRERRAALAPEYVALDRILGTALELTRSLASVQLDAHLRRAAGLLGMPVFLERVAVPMLRYVGDEWHAGRLSIAQEHLASTVLQEIILQTMRGFTQREGAPRLLVATPAGERHAIGAALVGAYAAAEGWDVIYLGTDLPAGDIATAAVAAQARVVALSIVFVDDPARLVGEVRALRSRLPADVLLIAGGSGAALLSTELSAAGIKIASSMADLAHGLEKSHRNRNSARS